jgi:hypothetical protein
MESEVRRDLLERHVGVTIFGDPHNIVAEQPRWMSPDRAPDPDEWRQNVQ